MEGANVTELIEDIKLKLVKLSCPYVENVADSWLQNLIFTPGTSRINLLKWLLSKCDIGLSEILHSYNATDLNHFESDAQNILSMVSSLGLCFPGDIALVKGTTTGQSQMIFTKTLVDLASELNNPDEFDSCTYTKGNSLSDKIANRQPITLSYCNKSNFLPADLQHILDIRMADRSAKNSVIPDVNELQSNLKQLDSRIEALTSKMKLNSNQPEQEAIKANSDKNEMKLVLSDLNMMMASFAHSYKDVMHLCQADNTKEYHQLNDGLLQDFSEKIEKLNNVLSSYGPIKCDIESTFNQLTKSTTDDKDDLKKALESLTEYNKTLERSLLYSKYTHND
ncbi:hypothetical protein HELRODRAFT_190775 [Helobdella robusta]|uniref:Uncharacterized protein n=1 Tax=Helobdella robusta TaxID=6412 RepID=T1FSA3_HELRO|nr:hypothetical protein HELRODRAFT_190775 [Helobdella robusta]ESO08583.1 hypothetical protein HELRODRAFT_190775 [Helobdella robusta]